MLKPYKMIIFNKALLHCMKFPNLNTQTKLTIGFSIVIMLTIAIVMVSFYSLSEIQNKNNDYEIVVNAQKKLFTGKFIS